MDIQLLRTFLEVYKLRHFARAADQLFIIQSAVSARIHLLEQAVGTPLFIRKRNAIEPTTAGLRLHRHAQSIVDTWERARQEAGLEAEQQSLMAVGALYDLWPVILDRGFVDFYKSTPEVTWRFEANITEQLVRKLDSGVLDVSFVFDTPASGLNTATELFHFPLVLVSSNPDSAADKALARNHIYVDWGTAFAIHFARLYPDAPAPKVRVDCVSVALELIRASGGSAYLPESTVDPYLSTGRLYRVPDAAVINRSVYAAYRVGSDREPTIKKMLDALR